MPRKPRSAPPPGAAPPPDPSPACVYSTSIEGDLGLVLGRPHYSYRFAEAKFLAAFAASGRSIRFLRSPEYYATEQALTEGGDGRAGPFLHLIFRSTEQIRLLKPARNIACYAWEFEVMRDWTGPGEHPFLNQTRMLSLCDEIWVPCCFTRDVLLAHGIGRVHVIPAPIAMPDQRRLSRADALACIGHLGVMPLIHNFLLSQADNARAAAAKSQTMIDVLSPFLPQRAGKLVYLSILNPEDFRKNLDALLRGFHHFRQSHPSSILIVKVLTSPERFSLERVISEVLPNKLASGSVYADDSIVFVNRYLNDEDMTALYCLADFYLCASMAEGQNLPLLEAMAHGVVPVTTANTAMADYITPDNAFVIETDRVAAPTEHLAGSIAGRPYGVDVASARHVHAALIRSAQSSPASRETRAAAAAATVARHFSHAALWPAIQARLDAAAGS